MLLIAAISVAVLLQLAPHHAAQDYYTFPGPPGYSYQPIVNPILNPVQTATAFVPQHDPLYGAAYDPRYLYFAPTDINGYLVSPYDVVPPSEVYYYSPQVAYPAYTIAEYEVVPNPYDFPVSPYSPNPYEIAVYPYSTNPYDIPVATYSPNPYDIPVSPYSPYPYDIPVSPYSSNPYDVSVPSYSPNFEGDMYDSGSLLQNSPEVYTGMGGDEYQDTMDKLITIDANLGYNNPKIQENPGLTRDEIVYNSLMNAINETPKNQIRTTVEVNHYGESGLNNFPEYHDSESNNSEDDEDDDDDDDDDDLSSAAPSVLHLNSKEKMHRDFSDHIQSMMKKTKKTKFRDPKDLVDTFLRLEKRMKKYEKLEDIENVNPVDKLNETSSSEEDNGDYPTKVNSSRIHHHDDHISDYEENYENVEIDESEEFEKLSEARKALDSSSDVHTDDNTKKVVDLRLKSLSPFPKPAVTSIGFGLARSTFTFDGQAQRSASGKPREPINISKLLKHHGKVDEMKTKLNISLPSEEESGHEDEHRAKKQRRNINYPRLTLSPFRTESEKKPGPKSESRQGSGKTGSVNVNDSPLYYYKCCMLARNALIGNSSTEDSRKKRSISDHTTSLHARLLHRPVHSRATAYLSNSWYSRLGSRAQNMTWMPRLGLYNRLQVDNSSLHFLNHNTNQQDSPPEKVKPSKKSRNKSSPKRKSKRRPAAKKGSSGRPKTTSEEPLAITLPPAEGSTFRY